LKEGEAFLRRFGLQDFSLLPLEGDGSLRRFWRVKTKHGSLVLIFPQPGAFGLREARSYVLIGKFLREKGLPVPRIYAYDEEKGLILVEDLGDVRLQDVSPSKRGPFYHKALWILRLLREATEDFPKEAVLESLSYEATLMWEREALYFLKEFLAPNLKEQEFQEVETLLHSLWEQARRFARPQAVLHRDFQARNLMIKAKRLYLIDFQGARLGPSAYDLASLLIDPYVALPKREREFLRERFESWYPFSPGEFEALALFRNFQILGAFAKLSKAGKSWFKDYIPQALTTLRELLGFFFPEGKLLIHYLPRF